MLGGMIRVKIFLTIIFILNFTYIVKSENCTVAALCKCEAQNGPSAYKDSVIGKGTQFAANNPVFDLCNGTKKGTVAGNPLAVDLAPARSLIISCQYLNKSSTQSPPKFIGEDETLIYLNYPCEAPPPQEGHGYSTGSILLMIFFTCVFGYLGLGICVNYFLLGARGIELLPHVSFWKELPGLVKDGATFIQNGCKARPSELATASPEGYDAI